jgi:hypothetical protein
MAAGRLLEAFPAEQQLSRPAIPLVTTTREGFTTGLRRLSTPPGASPARA